MFVVGIKRKGGKAPVLAIIVAIEEIMIVVFLPISESFPSD